MFSIDHWQEIFESIRQHKLRTALTAFGVFWGIFMLIILLAGGSGLQNGAMEMFKDDAVNSVWLIARRSSLPYDGLKPGRDIDFTLQDVDFLQANVPEIDAITPRKRLSRGADITRGTRNGSFEVLGVYPGYAKIEKTIPVSGRVLNELDLRERRRSVIIGEEVQRLLFEPGEEPLGEWINIIGVPFKIVGTFTDVGGDREVRRVFIPVTTMQNTFDYHTDIGVIALTTKPGYLWSDIEKPVLSYLGKQHRFDPADPRAVYVNDSFEEFTKFTNLFSAIKLFVGLVGVGTLFAGMMGVSNIMLVTVKERTKEIGVRKALGATPGSVLSMVLSEAVFLTSVAGYFGLLVGVGSVELYNKLGWQTEQFSNPQVDITTALIACAVLVVAGALAGLLPARHAVKIKPIEALRHD